MIKLFPEHLINKILLYNIHPVAEIFKFLIYEWNVKCIIIEKKLLFYEYALDYHAVCYTCYFCNIKLNYFDFYCLNRFNFCKKCFNMTDSNDQIHNYQIFEYLENKIVERKTKFNSIYIYR
jgi:hypothetical protein